MSWGAPMWLWALLGLPVLASTTTPRRGRRALASNKACTLEPARVTTTASVCSRVGSSLAWSA